MGKIITVLLSFLCFSAAAQQPTYNLANVPEAIKTNASVVVHLENIELNVESLEKITLKVHKIFTVLNEEGKDALIFNQYSSGLVSLEEAEIKVLDANGKVKEKHKKRDMVTTAIGEGLVEDGYVTYYPVTSTSYPVTVEISYEQKFKGTLYIPPYRFISPGEGIVESSYTAKVPAELGLRYKAVNTSIQPVTSEAGNYKLYKWTVKELPPIEDEEGGASAGSQYPHIALAANHFSHYGLRGDLSSWKTLGLWSKELYKDLDVLPADRQQFFAEMVKDAPTEKEKIKRIYTYLQRNFRYVSIQLGIGGWKPFSAEFTDKRKYGDCKALSNYMKAALRSVGIKSHVAIINANYNDLPVDADFPSDEFNHVILCVPAQKDSIWLECTSSTNDFGELGTFTENRNALLITDEGGVLVPTPKSKPGANVFESITKVNVSDDLSAQTETILKTRGKYKELISNVLKDKKDDQKGFLVSYLGCTQPDDFELVRDGLSDGYSSQLRMAIRSVSEFKAGSKWFISPRVCKMWAARLPKSDNRKFDFYFRFPFEKMDTTVFKLPAGIKPEALPKEKELSCDYAFYKTKYWYNEAENVIYSVAAFTLKQHKILASDYAAVKKFFDDLIMDHSQKIVIKKEG